MLVFIAIMIRFLLIVSGFCFYTIGRKGGDEAAVFFGISLMSFGATSLCLMLFYVG